MSMAGYKNAKAARIGFIGTGYDKKIFKNTNNFSIDQIKSLNTNSLEKSNFSSSLNRTFNYNFKNSRINIDTWLSSQI